MLEFSVSNQALTRLDTAQVVADSQNYLMCSFRFSDDWAGMSPTATFGHADVESPISVPIVDGVCQVPHEVIRPYGFYLAVYGTGQNAGGSFTHIPTNVTAVEVEDSGEGAGLGVPQPTPDFFDRIMAQLRNSEAAAVGAKVSAAASAQAAADAQAQGERAADSAGSSARSAAGSAREAARDTQEVRSALAAVRSFAQDTAGSAVEAAESAVEAAESAETVRDAALLARSHAQGTGEYDVLGSFSQIPWSEDGDYDTGALGLEADHVYRVTVDETTYTAIARSLQISPLLVEEEWQPENPPASWEDDDPADLDDPTDLVDRRVLLRAGPLVIVDDPVDSQSCHISTSDPSVRCVNIFTDGHDNARYYMNQALEAAGEAGRKADQAAQSAQNAQAAAQAAAAAKTYVDEAVEGKQDKLTGTEGQIVTFDAEGSPVAADPVTMVEKDDPPQALWDQLMDAMMDPIFGDGTKLPALITDVDFLNNTLVLRKDAAGTKFSDLSEFDNTFANDLAFWIYDHSNGEDFIDGANGIMTLTWWELQYAIIHKGDYEYPSGQSFPPEMQIKASPANQYPWKFKNVGNLPVTGGTMSGDIDMGGCSVTGLPDPRNGTDAATKGYVDAAIAAALGGRNV